jgi:hypothetical protein
VKACSIAGCSGKHYGQGLCGTHYRRKHAEQKRQYDQARRDARRNDPVAREAKRQQDHAYYLANKERHAEQCRKWRLENSERAAAYWREYYLS